MDPWYLMTAQVYIGLWFLFTGFSMYLTTALYAQQHSKSFMKKQPQVTVVPITRICIDILQVN